ncbi:cellulose synthase operon protein YhjQ/BcsQ [Granulicella cerasi]|uniref:Cellulose synthase operon protein YhjQ/BcsQ n=2 Tax=Granulicella cerasi TaxID=741063 RepID=A0ABW1ZDA1_9BACT
MRLRAAEEQRQAESLAQREAEVAASEAEKAAREAEEAARLHEEAARKAAEAQQKKDTEQQHEAKNRAQRQAEEMSRIAASERIEAARRAEAVAAAEAAARREAREMEDARVSAERQAQRYAASDVRRRAVSGSNVVGGRISDPYIDKAHQLPGRVYHQPSVPDEDMMPVRHSQSRVIVPQLRSTTGIDPVAAEVKAPTSLSEAAIVAARGTRAIEREPKENPQAAPDTFFEKPRPARQAVSEGSTTVIPIAPRSQQFPPALSSLSSPDAPIARPAASQASRSLIVTPSVSKAEYGTSGFVPVAPAPIQAADDTLNTSRTSSILGLDMSPVEHDPSEIVPVAQPRPSTRTRTASRNDLFAAEMEQAPSKLSSGKVPVAQPVVTAEENDSPGQRAYLQAKAEAQAKADAALAQARRVRGYQPDEASGFFAAYGSARERVANAPSSGAIDITPVPAWIERSDLPREDAPKGARVGSAIPSSDSLQRSRERVASRWYALKGVFDYGVQEQMAEKAAEEEARSREVPLVAVFSLAGGVGKTSLVASLARALSATGETILLADTTSHGLLPFYFGASELLPEKMRRFSPPSGSNDAPICMISYDVMHKSGDPASQEWFSKEIAQRTADTSRAIFDLTAVTPWVARRLAQMNATVLVPLAPDMNSVISLGAIEKFFAEIKDGQGKKVEPVYLLNRFDATQRLHLDVREVMRQQLGDRLLPFVIRRAASVPEALAEGMTVMDYATDSSVAEDYRNLAAWLKAQKAPAVHAQKTARWSEQ